MSHITLYAGGSAASAKLNVCKKCMNDIVANIKHGVYIGKLEEINKLIKDL
jgi:transposase